MSELNLSLDLLSHPTSWLVTRDIPSAPSGCATGQVTRPDTPSAAPTVAGCFAYCMTGSAESLTPARECRRPAVRLVLAEARRYNGRPFGSFPANHDHRYTDQA